jgi:Arc/MetJ family transcription regulator
VAALRSATSVATNAITTFPSEGPLNEARHTVGIALPDLIRGPLTQEKIDNAEGAIGVCMVELLQR